MNMMLLPLRNVRIPAYVFYASVISIGGYIFGFDTGSIGSITLMKEFQATFGTLTSTIQGLLVSIILIPAAIVSFGSGSISDRLSRTYATSLGCIIYGVGSLICCLAGLNGQSQSSALAMVFVGRCISGAGEGVFLSAVTIYAIEVAPHHARGRVGCIVQLYIALGTLLGYFTCYGSLHIPNSVSWRLPWIMQTVVCTLLGTVVPFLPHSPRWLVHVGRIDDAKAVMKQLGVDEEELALTTYAPAGTEIAEKMKDERKGWRKNLDQFKAAFAPDLRGRTLLALFMLGAQQLIGIDGLLFYAPTLFKQAGLDSEHASFLASGVTGIVNVVFTLIGQSLSDRCSRGRRPALIGGGIIMGLTMTIIGVLYSLPSISSAGQWTVIALIFIYFIAFVLTWAILSRTWVSESQPVRTRASVSSLALTVNWACNFVVAFTTPKFLETSPSGPYFFWAASAWIAVIVYLIFMPETKGQSIDGEEQNLALDIRVGWLRDRFETPRPSLSRRSSVTIVGTEEKSKAGEEATTTTKETSTQAKYENM
ncbi:general substrate transporter [Hymenopellis radicata]|nr:general substrate transporter [Hymenopellis radicata]